MGGRAAVQAFSDLQAVGWQMLRLLGLCLGVLAAGCASLSRPPADLDLRQSEIVPDLSPPALRVDGYSGKGTAAGAGAAKGFGTGAAAGAVACMATGPFFPLCVAAVVPVTTTIGTLGWATAAAVTSEGADAVVSKRDLLESEIDPAQYPSMLAAQLREAARQRFDIDLRVGELPGGVPPPWRIELAVTEVACEDNKPQQPFALRVEGRVRLLRAGQTQVVYEKSLTSRTELKHTTAEWRANGAAAAKAGLERSLQSLAEGLLKDLLRPPQDMHRAWAQQP